MKSILVALMALYSIHSNAGIDPVTKTRQDIGTVFNSNNPMPKELQQRVLLEVENACGHMNSPTGDLEFREKMTDHINNGPGLDFYKLTFNSYFVEDSGPPYGHDTIIVTLYHENYFASDINPLVRIRINSIGNICR